VVCIESGNEHSQLVDHYWKSAVTGSEEGEATWLGTTRYLGDTVFERDFKILKSLNFSVAAY
jgi:hypothetical protein